MERIDLNMGFDGVYYNSNPYLKNRNSYILFSRGRLRIFRFVKFYGRWRYIIKSWNVID